jgi:teichuronic acid biosynthesis glycosyltransferase TuaC
MRVALVTTSYPAFPGDPSGHFVEAEARLLARDHDVTVFTTGIASASFTSDATEPLRIIRTGGGAAFGWPGAAFRIGENPLRLGSAMAWMRRTRARLRALPRFDRVVAHWALPSAFPVAYGLSVPVEIVSHGGDVRLLTRLPPVVRGRVMNRLLRDATRWRFVSQTLHDDLSRALSSRDQARLSAIASVAAAALELPDVRVEVGRRREELGGERLVVCVGRLVASKGFDRALDHVARETRAGRRARVVVVGDGPERTKLEGRARRLGVDARFVGRTTREDALAWIGAADGLLHASRAEGFSTVIREAEALGVPVVFVDAP